MQPVLCSVTATDSDHWVNEDTNEEGTEEDELVYNWSVSGGWISGFGSSILWMPPNVTGTYTITCTVDDRPLFIGPHDKGTRNDEMVIKSIQVQVPPRVWDDGAPIGRMLDEDGVEMVDEDGNPRENGRIIAPQDTTQHPACPRW